MDSQVIAFHLDKVLPSPPLFLSGDASYAMFVSVGKFLSLVEPGFHLLLFPACIREAHSISMRCGLLF